MVIKMNKKKKKKLFKLKKAGKIIFATIFIATLIVSVLLIMLGKNPKEGTAYKYNYNRKFEGKYKVYLKENAFYEEKFLDEGLQYPSSLVDYIDIDLNYSLNGADLLNLDYDYNIEATIIGEYENSNTSKSEIWHKKYVLVDKVESKVESQNSFNIANNIKIDYDLYNRKVNEYKASQKLAIDAYLRIDVNVNYNGIVSKNNVPIKNTETLSMTIPLTSNTFKIQSPDDMKNGVIDGEENNNPNYLIITIGVLLFITDWVGLLTIYSKVKVHKTEYVKDLNKIMKDYSEIIVEVTTPLEYNEDIVILDIKTFEDMVDIEEEIKSPILLYEVEKGKECWFVIMTDTYLYRYILSEE